MCILQQSNNHAYTGSEGEPEDGPAVAASIYVAVIVYAVRYEPTLPFDVNDRRMANTTVPINRASLFSAVSKLGFTSKTAGAAPYHFVKPQPSLNLYSISFGVLHGASAEFQSLDFIYLYPVHERAEGPGTDLRSNKGHPLRAIRACRTDGGNAVSLFPRKTSAERVSQSPLLEYTYSFLAYVYRPLGIAISS